MNIKKIARFTMWNQLYAIFGHTQAKVIFLWKNGSFFYAILGLRGTFRNITPRINEKVQ